MTQRSAPGRRRVATRAEAVAALEDLYAQLPAIECKGLCHDSCTSIDASELERERVRERGVELPPGRRYREVRALIDAGKTPRCPALGPLNNCRVYDVRPLICRIFGVAEGLRCEHGCIPEWIIPDWQVAQAMAEVELMSQQVTGVSRRPL